MAQLSQRKGWVPQCTACPVRNLALFQPLSPDEIQAAQRYRSEFRLLRRGELVYAQGEPAREAYTLFSGWAFLCQDLPAGRRQVLSFVLPGDLLGFQAEIADGVRGHSARVLSDAALCVFPLEAIVSMFGEHPELGIRLIWMAAQDQALVHEHLASIGRRSAQERVAGLLLELFLRIRARQPEQGTDVPCPITQGLMADALGLTKIHVNRTLKKLRDAGLLLLTRRRLQVPDPERLAKAAGLSSAVLTQRPMI